MVRSVGIIGFGRFGQLAAKHLKDYFEVTVYDEIDKSVEAGKIGVDFTNVKDCASRDVVLFCVAISKFEEALKQSCLYLKKDSIIIDVCSVKEKPVNAMRKLVPKNCECIGTHPLFGPDTVKNGLNGKKIVICPVRVNHLAQIINFLTKLGLVIITSTPEEHDRQMARSLALIHLLGRSLKKVGISDVKMATPTHEMFVDLVNIVKNDSEQLFLDMQHFNRFARKTRKTLISELIKLDGELNGSAI